VKGKELCHGHAFNQSPTNYHHVDEVPQHQEWNEEDWSCMHITEFRFGKVGINQ